MSKEDRKVIAAALAAFILAGLSGVFFRWGMNGGWLAGLSLGNIRHAHSHLMYFSWAVPSLFVLLIPNDLIVRRCAWAAWLTGLLAWPLFLFYGYTAGTFGPVTMPPAVAISGLVMLIWYGFVWRWIQLRKPDPLAWAAVIFLVASSIGAWGISAVAPLGLKNPVWVESFKHMFLSYFTEGWLTLGCLALLVRRFPLPPSRLFSIALALLGAGVATAFLFAMPSNILSPAIQWYARLAAVLSGVGLGWIAVGLWKQSSGWWRLPVGALLTKSFALVVLGPWPTIWWADHHQDRIHFLHLLLLGIVSSTILLMALADDHRVARPFFSASIVLILMLIPVSTVWVFPSVMALWMPAIGLFSVLPVLAAVPVCMRLLRT